MRILPSWSSVMNRKVGSRTGLVTVISRPYVTAIGGLKVVAASGWFAARPSGTENIYKIYAESFKDQAHLDSIVMEAQEIVSKSLTTNSTAPAVVSR